jgi:hypothetical protein
MALPDTDSPGIWDKIVYQGDTFTWSFSLESGEEGSEVPVNLTGVTIIMTIKKARGSTVPTLWTGSTTGGQITIGSIDNNVVNITIPATQMALLPATTLVYDIQFSQSGQVETYLTGNFTVTADVTE